MSATVFNLTEGPVQVSAAGNRVPGRCEAVVDDTSDPHYTAALERGELVVLSASAPAAPVAEPVPVPEPQAEDGDDPAEAGEPAAESKKKQPSKAKEN